MVCDGYEVKQLLHSRFIFENIHNGKIEIMTSLTFSNESEIGTLSVCDFDLNFINLFKSSVYLRNPKQRRKGIGHLEEENFIDLLESFKKSYRSLRFFKTCPNTHIL